MANFTVSTGRTVRFDRSRGWQNWNGGRVRDVQEVGVVVNEALNQQLQVAGPGTNLITLPIRTGSHKDGQAEYRAIFDRLFDMIDHGPLAGLSERVRDELKIVIFDGMLEAYQEGLTDAKKAILSGGKRLARLAYLY